MAQDVGPILEMVTEKYLLRSEKEWEARQNAINYFEEVVQKLTDGDIKGIAEFTHKNFNGPIQQIIPWATNLYTETIIETIKAEFGEQFWGFWMMGGMSGGGMGFIFAPESKLKAQQRLQEIMSDTKKKYEHGIPFAMEPVVYDFKINDKGTFADLLNGDSALLNEDYYTLILPKLLKRDLHELTACQRNELSVLSKSYKTQNQYTGFISNLFDRIIPQAQEDKMQQKSLNNVLEEFGFNPGQHHQIKKDLQTGRIGLSKNRLAINTTIADANNDELTTQEIINANKEYTEIGLKALQNGELAIVTLAGGVGSRWTKGAGVVKSLNPFAKFAGKHRNFVEIHLAKTNKTKIDYQATLPHVFTTSYLTHKAIAGFVNSYNKEVKNSHTSVSQGQVIGLRLIPTERDLRFMWEEMHQQLLDEQAQKVQQSVRAALINWAKTNGEGEDYRDNLPSQCIHPVGHWYEIPNLFLNGTLKKLIAENPNLKHLMVHNIDTLGTNADPAMLGYHIQNNKGMTIEVISRKLDDRGGGLAKINGQLRLVEGLALPDEKVEFNLSYYNTNTFWINIDKLLQVFGLNRNDLNNSLKVEEQVYKMASRMPTYVIIKDVKKRWGKGQEDIFPVTQFEKLWGDMTAIPELACSYVNVIRNRGQQLKDVAQLDGWLRDGSKDFIDNICNWEK
jgi:UDP-N-acetylglucosamine pyrophosphorylase